MTKIILINNIMFPVLLHFLHITQSNIYIICTCYMPLSLLVYIHAICIDFFGLHLEAAYVCLCACTVCVSWEHLDVWGELASHKRSLTHHLISQGWASRCPLL